LEKKEMKDLVKWLMSTEELGESMTKGWNWLLETPPDRSKTKGKTSDQITIEHMTQLLESMQLEVVDLQNIVEQLCQITQETQYQYNLKFQHYENLKAMVLLSKEQGNILEARMAMAKVVQTKRIIPTLEATLNSYQDRLIGIHEIYVQKEADLAVLEMDLKRINIQSQMNDSINGYRDLEKSRDLIALQERFRNAQADIEHRYQEIQITSKLESPSNWMEEPMNIQDIDDLIAKLESEEF
jgi:hypothetical protein